MIMWSMKDKLIFDGGFASQLVKDGHDIYVSIIQAKYASSI